jgi:ADP-ribose pyrophosphatase
MVTREYPDRPQVAVGAIVLRDDKVLLVKRGQPPGEGLWAIPGGRVKLGETLQEAAEREVREEAGVIIRAKHPVYTFDVVHRDDQGRIRFHYVIVDLLADYVSGIPHPGSDARGARWITSQELEELSVSTATREVLRNMFRFGKER